VPLWSVWVRAKPALGYDAAVNKAAIQKSFERFLRTRELKLTPQRRRIFERAFSTHEHFSAETLYGWMRAEEGSAVSRATVYRTLGLLVEGGFLGSLDPGSGELLYEHVLGHRHHDHLVCIDCGKIEEFSDERIEAYQREAALRKGFTLHYHNLRLFGTCASCTRKRERAPALKASE
jgi:Fur family ferric uptake transcriptional regulator